MSTPTGFAPSTAITTRTQFLDAYDAIDVIGNGSFGIIRKVRRKEDGSIYARKELNFERMSDRDKKQIVAEVNILKDLNHENIVRYHDRFVDSDQGMLYIVMEYCGGGDLAGVINSTKKRGQHIAEDTVWDYFLQIVLALHHCHSPHIKPGSPTEVLPNVVKRAPILHRDLKPENVFLDANGVVKLGDFGLSKQLGAQAFTNTYVGTPYYMSPELFGELHYDTKSDIWSLGCLIYELCALNPPFHEAQTHAELASYVKKGRVPTLPLQYGHYLQAAIKAMMSLEPAKRPSAANLLAHERMNLAFKTRETQEMLNKVIGHRQTLQARAEKLDKREQETLRREAELTRRDQEFNELALAKEAEILAQVAAREEEMRQWVFTREAELKQEMLAQEEATQQAVAAREMELEHMWNEREALLRAEIERKDLEIKAREETLKREAERLHRERMGTSAGSSGDTKPSRKAAPEPKNDTTPVRPTQPRTSTHLPVAFATPEPVATAPNNGGSAMKGVVLGDGQTVPTPVTTHLRQLLTESPSKRIDLINVLDRNPQLPPAFHPTFMNNFNGQYEEKENSPPDASSVPSSPSSTSSTHSSHAQEKTPQAKTKRRSSARVKTESHLPAWNLSPSADDLATQTQAESSGAAKLLAPHLNRMQRTVSAPALWTPEDDDDLPSPFLKRIDRTASSKATSSVVAKGLALDKKPSKPVLKQDANGAARSVPKATAIKPTTGRPSVGKAVARTQSSRP